MNRYIWIISFCLCLPVHALKKAVAEKDPSQEVQLEGDGEVDINRKNKEALELASNGAKYFAKVSLEKACNDFVHDPIWRKGELFVFVFDEDGVCFANGDDTTLIWKDISTIRGISGKSIIQDMLSLSGNGDNITYLWDSGFKSSYIYHVKKDGKKYIIGAGFFPENAEFTAEQLVKTAVSFFKRLGREVTFGLITNPNGPFVKGDIYTFAYTLDGLAVAHGDNAALIGQNLIDQVDSRGLFLIKEMINIAKTKGSGWLDYYWRNEAKRSYLEKVVDPFTKTEYFISAGYYPHVNLQSVRAYVNKAIKFLKANGSQTAFSTFSNQIGEFAKGGLGIMVYDFEGKCLANGVNPAFVGQNLIKLTDSDGRFYIKESIDIAKKYGKGIVSYSSKNAYSVLYIESLDVPDGKFIIGCTFYPASKVQSTQTIVFKAIDFLTDHTSAQAFAQFSDLEGGFYRGDLNIFVYTKDGTRLVNGTQTADTWRNFSKAVDQEGRLIIDDLLSTGLSGGGWMSYKTRNATRRVYVKSVEKIEKEKKQTYIIGSGYFL